MQSINYQTLIFTEKQAAELCETHIGIKGNAQKQTGELDFNYKITTETGECYILKISRPTRKDDYFDFQQALLLHIEGKKPDFLYPKIIKTLSGNNDVSLTDEAGQTRRMRLLDWVEGRLWSAVNPQLDDLRFSLGQQIGKITAALSDFQHPQASRHFEWDVAQAAWTKAHFNLFDVKQKACVTYFSNQFETHQKAYKSLRKSVIHNDANDNNIVVSDDLRAPSVKAVIDYGDAIKTQTINDLAVALAYAVMEQPDPLAAALPLVAGYHQSFPLQEDELALLHNLTAMRLVISVTKSAINKIKEPDNKYLQISEKPAWDLLYKWKNIPPQYAHYFFRAACGFEPVPHQRAFENWANAQQISVHDLFPSLSFSDVYKVDLSIGSLFLGNYAEYKSTPVFTSKMAALQAENPDKLIAGGYLEARPLYATKAFEMEGNNGPEYRTIHLGVDFWHKEGTPVHAFMNGEVVVSVFNTADKDYGGLIILKHKFDKTGVFYTLYGHLSKASVENAPLAKIVKKGKPIGWLGNPKENGNWTPHLHFQIILDLLDNETDFAGVANPNKLDVWSAISPDPNLLFKNDALKPENTPTNEALLAIRKKHLGRSLSISYEKPLKIQRGERQYLIDDTGRRYLDTVNNVAHVGHEHPSVVRAGQQQMAVLNTNTRYLHENILDLAQALIATLPKELSVLHFVNSGSEANELALRMAKAVTNQKDIIALEVGYHGNTQGCIGVSSYKFNGKGGKGQPEETHIVPLPDSFRGLYQGKKSETGALYAAHIDTAIEQIQAKGRGVAAFLAESIVSCGGQIDLPDNYLKLAYASVRKAGGVCIADEVQVGFGRVGKHFWGFELQDVVPDIVTMGKPIGNGHPLAVVACTEAVAIAFANGMEYFNTFGGNPVSAAIGLATLNVIKQDRLQENALEIGEFLKKELRQLQINYPIIGDVRGEGLFLGFELVEKGKIPATDKTSYLANRMKTHGILISVDGPQNNVIKIKPPLCFSRENAEDLIRFLRKILGEDFMKLQ
jgi:4-aminobutyrate aminotransferase-like enzyme/Ser/Thr protein kinase RdoA (MazF antagonist)